jgi:GT2 family glycosyltransferase
LKNPLVWAVIVNWNGRELLEACLKTLLASDYPNLSVAVVDNDSTDGSGAMVREQFDGVELIENHENLGYAAGANTGIRYAQGRGADFVLLLNNDVELDAAAVTALVGAAGRDTRTAMVGPLIYYWDRPELIWSAGGKVSFWTGNIRHRGLREKDAGQFADIEEVDYVTGCAVLVSLPAVSEIGLMDEGYFMYNEDTDWCTRARRAGYSVVLAPAAKLWHKVSMSSGGGLTPFKIYHRLRSTLRYFSIHARPYHWLGILPATAVRALAFASSEAASGHGANVAAIARGVRDAALGRGRE